MGAVLPLGWILAAVTTAVAQTCGPPPGRVRTGIDVLAAESCARLRGKRVGLITNHTGRARDGRSTVEILFRAPGVRLAALFAPEHGFAGELERAVEDVRHPETGLVVHSLYGRHRKPTAAMLANLDVLVFDIQDIGCRFYTYVSTMGLAMEAAAEHGLDFVVLDRPNPIGGERVAGPLLDEGAESFTAFHRLPIRHGMTAGELARMFAAERSLDLDLDVVRCVGWRRGDTYDATGLRWIPPSPNMRRLVQALLYPGVGLIEFTNVSVGRGTDTPFERLGAPWIDELALAARLNADGIPGLRCVPIRFTPTASRFAGKECGGVDLLVTDWRRFDPLALGAYLACALRDLFGDAWRMERIRRLLRHRATYELLRDGAEAPSIVASWRADVEAFAARRRPFLLYPR